MMDFSTNVSSIKTEPTDIYTETIKMVEGDFNKFNEFVDQNLRVEDDIEKQLEKEDKKCTFLKHTVLSLKKQLENMEKICADQRNFMYAQQMEMEQISSKILEEMEEKKIAYPQEGAIPYREMMKIVQRMVDHISNFKTTIVLNIKDCTNRSEEIIYWENISNQLISIVWELKISQNQLRLEINQIASFINDHSLEPYNKSIERLQEVRQELKTMKSSHHEAVTEKEKLAIWKEQILAESVEKSKLWSSTQENYEKLKNSSINDINNLRMEISSLNQRYFDIMNEMSIPFSTLENEISKYERLINEKSAVLEDVISKRAALRCEDEKINLNIEKLDHELTTLKESNRALETQKVIAKNMYDSLQLHNNSLKTSIDENEIKPEDLPECIEQNDLENIWNHNEKLKQELEKQKQEKNDIRVAEKEQKCKLSSSGYEVEFLNLLYNKIDVKVYEEKRKAKKEMDDKIERCVENVNELSNIVTEKNLMLDYLRADELKYFNSIYLLEKEIKTQTKENIIKKTKLSEIEAALIDEEKNLKDKVNLFENLKRNTFTKQEIPVDLLQSLKQIKNEFDKLKAERIELEKILNDSKKIEEKSVEKNTDSKVSEVSEVFSDADSKKLGFELDMKKSAYKMFRERIMKKNSSPMFG